MMYMQHPFFICFLNSFFQAQIFVDTVFIFDLRPITHVVLRGFYIEVRTIGIKIDLGFRGDRCSPKSPKGESVFRAYLHEFNY